MDKSIAILVAAAAAIVSGGCGQSNSPPQTADRDAIPVVSLDLAPVQTQTQRELNSLQREAVEAMRNVGSRGRSQLQSHGDELSAFAAQMAEEAKDRALDIPEAVDRALDRHAQRWRDGRSTRRTTGNRDG